MGVAGVNKKTITTLFWCLVVASTVFILTDKVFGPSAQQRHLSQTIPAVDPVKPDTSPFSNSYHTDYARLMNRIGRRMEWDAEDQAWLMGYLTTQQPSTLSEDMPAIESWLNYDMAHTLIEDRLATDIEVPKSVQEAYEYSVQSMLVHPQPRVRSRGIAGAVNSGLVAATAFRAVLEDLRDHDPDPGVQYTAELKLKQADGLATERDDCPTCPGG